jgi:valyl-tRNA synthetase
MNVDRAAEVGIAVDPSVLGGMPTVPEDAPLEARWILAELHETATKVNQSLGDYRFDDAANTIYQFFWGSFCDWYIEIVKLRLDFSETADKGKTKAALTTLVQVFEAALRLLSPVMPFITEELWHAVYDGNPPAKSIALAVFPQVIDEKQDLNAIHEMGFLQELITGIRTIRNQECVEEKISLSVEFSGLVALKRIVDKNLFVVERLAKVKDVRQVEAVRGDLPHYMSPEFEVAIVYERTIDVAAERERLTKDIAKLEKQNASDEQKLSEPAFTAKAPANIVEGKRKQLAENRLLLEKAKAALAALPGN